MRVITPASADKLYSFHSDFRVSTQVPLFKSLHTIAVGAY